VSQAAQAIVIHKHEPARNINCAVSVTSLLSSIWVHSNDFVQFNWFIYICSQLLFALCKLQKRALLETPFPFGYTAAARQQHATNRVSVAKGLYSSTIHSVIKQLLISVFLALRCRSTRIEISRPLGVHRPR
jgi:CBS-domain-containing membrane protein